MKKLLILILLLGLSGCGDDFSDGGPAEAYVAGSAGHYYCTIRGSGTHIYVGDFQSATAADAYCIQVNDLLKKAPLPVVTRRTRINDGMNESAASAAAAAAAVSR